MKILTRLFAALAAAALVFCAPAALAESAYSAQTAAAAGNTAEAAASAEADGYAQTANLAAAVSNPAAANPAEEGNEFMQEARVIEQALPPEVRGELDEGGVTPESGAGALGFGGVLAYIWQELLANASKPLQLLCALCGVVLLCALADSLGDGGLKGTFCALGALAGSGMTVAAMAQVLDGTLSLLSDAAAFMLVFIPAFAGIAAVLGHTASATAVNTAFLAATQLFTQLAVNFLAPLCGTIMGLSVAGTASPQLDLGRLAELVKKVVTWALGLMMTVFTSVLSVQTFVTNASDNTLIRTAKFMISSGVPVVGGTISDAVNTVQGGLVMMKSTVGTYGIVAAAVMALPMLLTVICYKLSLMCAAALADVFGQGSLAGLFRSCEAVMGLILAVISCFLLLNTIAAVILLAITGGG